MDSHQALRRAFWMVKVPSMTLLVGPLLGYWGAVKLHLVPEYGAAALKLAAPVFLIAFVGGWLIWSIQVPRWRLWAYERVDDIDALERAAVEAQLIWPRGTFLERTEIATADTWSRIRALRETKTSRVT